ncbi:GNAT family N-acetyltransferase [Streptomyces sp. NPDC046197]|uniref:GNAT family N-acetyltransferase n=1 Tax=Streptomyces sp. NPDC046197 TaxID=3154337 RepID=UPI00341101E1
MFHVGDRPTEIHLARIELGPDHRGNGVGGRLIRSLCAWPDNRGCSVRPDPPILARTSRSPGPHPVARSQPGPCRDRGQIQSLRLKAQ